MFRSTGSESDADAGKAVAAIATKPKRKSSNSAGHDCTICRKSNMTLSGLKIHLLTHSGEKPFACTECEKRFTCSSNLKKHQRIHNRDYIYECSVCGKTCSDPSNMKKHMTVHSDEKAYTCPSCGKSYSYAQSLRQHMDDVHVGNGERRRKIKKKGHFPCPECGKVFGYYWRCSLHQARIHAVEKPYKCPECGKAFARETILNKHVQTHEKPFPCTVCERRFSFRDQLRKHMRIHTGEKPYTCEQCFRSFTQRGSLTEHLRTHTGEKPFSCTNCGQKFSSSSSLKRHERRVNACLSQDLAEEIPLPDTSHRRVIYITTQPVTMMGLASSTIPQPLVMDPRDVTGYSTRFSPVDHDYGNGAIAFHPSALTDTGRITMVDRSSCFAVPNEDVKPKLRPNGTIAMATQDYRPNYGTITMVSNNVDRSLSVGNLSFAMANQMYEPSILQSIAMDLEDVKNRLPLYRNDSPFSAKEAKSFQYYNPPAHPSVTLTTNGVKPLAAMEDVNYASVDYQARPPNNQHSNVDCTNYYARSPGGPSISTHSPGTENVEPFIQTSVVTMASKNVRPYEYPRITMVTEDGKALSEINGIKSMVPSHLLPKTSTIASTLVTA